MANQTVTTDTNLSSVIGNLNNGENLTIDGGAVLTIDVSPNKLIGQVVINNGEMLLDGANATNPIVFVGEQAEEININGAGAMRTTLGWWTVPTVGDGNANQTFDVSSYFVDAVINSDVFSGVWVETGRRINYDGGSGVMPEVGDWLYKTNDKTVHGRITEVNGTTTSGYVVVQFLTGSILNNEQFELHTIQNNNGPDYQKSFFASAVGSDVLEPDVYQEFGNAFQKSTDFLPSLGSGISGFGYSQQFQSNTLTFGDGVNGFIVPDGAHIRIPMIHFATSNLTLIPSGQSDVNNNGANRYEIETINGGDIYLNGVSYGSATCQDNLGSIFNCLYVAANSDFGIFAGLTRQRYEHCIFTTCHVHDFRSVSRSLPSIVDLVEGADLFDVFTLIMNDTSETTQLGGQTSIGVNYTRCIQISNDSAAMEAELLRISDFEINDFICIGTPLVFNSSNNGTVKLLKTQQTLGGIVDRGTDGVVIGSGCNNIVITGWEVLNNSRPDDSLVIISDSSNIGIRCFHFIDDKFDNEALGALNGEEFSVVAGLCNNITFARCWIDRGNPNEFVLAAAGTTRNLIVMNCSGEYSGEIEPDGINTSFRGIHGGNGNFGLATGLELDLLGTAGSNTGDVFRSDTDGYIYCSMCPGSTLNPIEIVAGNPIFTKDGDVDLSIGDQFIVESSYFVRGHTTFTGVITTARNTSNAAIGINQWTGADIEFQYDNGSGYNGTWLDARIPSNLTSITDMVGGIKLKYRITGVESQTNGQSVIFHTTTTINDQRNNLHPIDQTIVSIRVSARDASSLGSVENARVLLKADEGGPLPVGTVIFNNLTTVEGIIENLNYSYVGDQPVIGRVRRGTNPTFYKSAPIIGNITETGLDLTAFMIRD